MRRRVPLAVAIALVAIVSTATAAYAYFTDDAFMSTGTSSTATISSQASPSCSTIFLSTSVRLSWSQVNPRYEYAWELRNSSNAAVAQGSVGNGVASGQPVTLDIATTQAGANGVFTVVIRARLASNIAWAAPATTTTTVRRQGILGGAMYCGAS